MRNEFNHCLYSLGPDGEIAQTQSMKLQEVKGQLKWGEIKPMDELRMKQMVKSIEDLKKLNRDIWSFLPRLEEECSKAAPKQSNIWCFCENLRRIPLVYR